MLTQSAHCPVDPLPAACASDAELRDPRIANTVSHAQYSRAQQARDAIDLSFEEWKQSYPGRVETVHADRLYIVELTDADGELKLGLVATQGKVFEEPDSESGKQTPYIRALWFKRCSEAHVWAQNPEFERYMDGDKRIVDALPTESCLLQVDDGDLTESSVERKWSKPKLKQALMKKIRWIASRQKLYAPAPARAAGKRARGA